MSEMKREYGYLFNKYNAIEKRKEKEQAELKTETSTEAIFSKLISEALCGIDYFHIIVRGEHKGIIGINKLRLQRELMTQEELNQAIGFAEKLSSGDKIIYWTRGANIHDPRKWFFKIERK